MSLPRLCQQRSGSARDSASPCLGGGMPKLTGMLSSISLTGLPKQGERWLSQFKRNAEGERTIMINRLLPALLALGAAVCAPAAHAGVGVLSLRGVFNGSPVITDTITGPNAPILGANEPFTLTALFDTSNVVFSLPGFTAYEPTSILLTVGGKSFSVETNSQSPTSGLTVAIFDSTGMFGPPFHVAAGFIANPAADGAGIVGDWTASSPSFTLPSLVSADYTTANYFGVGFGSGPCPMPPPGPGGACVPAGDVNTTVPIPLDGGLYALTLGEYSLNSPSSGIPVDQNPNLFSAQLTVPEPSTWAMMILGFAGLGFAGYRGSQKTVIAAV